MVDYTIPTYSRPDLGFKVSDYVTKYYKDKEEKEAEEEETIDAEGPQETSWGESEHTRMYPGHRELANKAGFSGLFGLNAARPGNKSYDAMIDSRKTDMQDWGIDFTHTIDGKRPNGWPAGHAKSNLSGKYSSQNFKDWMDLSGGKIGMAKKTTDTIPQTASTSTDEDALVTTSTDLPNLVTSLFSTLSNTGYNLGDQGAVGTTASGTTANPVSAEQGILDVMNRNAMMAEIDAMQDAANVAIDMNAPGTGNVPF